MGTLIGHEKILILALLLMISACWPSKPKQATTPFPLETSSGNGAQRTSDSINWDGERYFVHYHQELPVFYFKKHGIYAVYDGKNMRPLSQVNKNQVAMFQPGIGRFYLDRTVPKGVTRYVIENEKAEIRFDTTILGHIPGSGSLINESLDTLFFSSSLIGDVYMKDIKRNLLLKSPLKGSPGAFRHNWLAVYKETDPDIIYSCFELSVMNLGLHEVQYTDQCVHDEYMQIFVRNQQAYILYMRKIGSNPHEWVVANLHSGKQRVLKQNELPEDNYYSYTHQALMKYNYSGPYKETIVPIEFP